MKKKLVNKANIVTWLAGLFIIVGAILVIATKVPVRVYVKDILVGTSDYFDVPIASVIKGGVSPEINLYLEDIKVGATTVEWGKSDQLLVALGGLLIGLILIGFSFIPREKKGVRALLVIAGIIFSLVPIFIGAYFMSINGNFLNFQDPYYNKLIAEGMKAEDALKEAKDYSSQLSYGLPKTIKVGGILMILGAATSFASLIVRKKERSK